MNSKLTEKRDYLFDNLKALMLFLVVIGHILDPYIERQDSLYRYLMQYIYLFHMPMFAFITGYFTKNTEKARNSAVRNVLVPYIFWQLLYIITALLFIRLGLASYNTDVFKPSLLLPSSPLYYLLCVFVWKVFAADLKKLRFPVLFSFAAGLFKRCLRRSVPYRLGSLLFPDDFLRAGSFMYERTRRENQEYSACNCRRHPGRRGYTIRPAALQLSECPFYL